jgi:hypothetical protein
MKLVTKLPFYLLLIITSASVLAQEMSYVNSDLGTFATSDRISQRQVEVFYRNPRRDIFYPYANEAENGWDWGGRTFLVDGKNAQYDFTATGLQLLGGRKFSKNVSAEVLAGFHQIQNTSVGNSKLAFSGYAKSNFIFSDRYTSSIEVGHSLKDGTLIQTGNTGDQLTAITIKPNIGMRWSEHWRSQIRYQYLFISDDNKKSLVDLSTMYGISTGIPWIWFGLGIERLNYSHRKSTYWTPSEFISFGPRLEATVPIKGKVSASGGINLNRLYDKDTDSWGNGYYFSWRLQYGDRNETNLSIYLIKIESYQNSSRWDSTNAGLNLSVPF